MKHCIMTVFFNKSMFSLEAFLVIILSIKLPPNANKNKPIPSVDTMSKMQALLSKKDEVIQEKENIIDKKSDVIAAQKHRIEILEEYLRLANTKRFGASSEQTPPEQGHLFNEVEVDAKPEEENTPEVSSSDNDKNKTGRKPFAKSIPRHQVFAYLTDEEKAGAIDTFFVKVREELDIIPAEVQILEYMQEKAIFKDDKGNSIIKMAAVAKTPSPKPWAALI